MGSTLATTAAAGLGAPLAVWIALAALAGVCFVAAGLQHRIEGRALSEHGGRRDLAQRRLLARALAAAYQDGLRWHGRTVDAGDWESWQKRTWTLIFHALGQGEATCFLSDWGSGEQTLTGLDARLQWLADLIGRVDSVAPLTLLPDFDGEEWVSRR